MIVKKKKKKQSKFAIKMLVFQLFDEDVMKCMTLEIYDTIGQQKTIYFLA